MPLTICVVTRDAERNLERLLRSVMQLSAEIIVAETGSRDRTAEVAHSFGARVIDIAWQDDFAAAQNRALEHATGEWILWLNPDEELLAANREIFDELMGRPDALAYGVCIQEMMHPGQTTTAMEVWLPRLYRRRPDIRYVGRLHPHFVTPLEEIARRESKALYRTDIRIRHHAYASVVTPDKLRWTCRLLELELRDRPGQLHYLIEYGRNLLLLNDPRGHEILARAAQIVAAEPDTPVAPSPTVASLLEYLLAVSPEQSRSPVPISRVTTWAERWFPNSPPVLWALAQRAYQTEHFSEAARHLERLIELGRTGAFDRFAAFNPAIMAESALMNLGNCHLRLEDPDRAESCFASLLAHPAFEEKARRGLTTAQALRQRIQSR